MSRLRPPAPPRSVIAALAAALGIAVAADVAGLGDGGETLAVLPIPGAQAIVGALAILALACAAWIVRNLLARREDHYFEDIEDGDHP